MITSRFALVLLSLIIAGPVRGQSNHSAITPAPKTDQGWKDRSKLLDERLEQTPDTELLFIGDSITHGWEGEANEIWAKHFGPHQAVNLGISGDRTQHVLWRLQNAPLDGLKPKAAVLMIGTNNSNGEDNTPGQIAEGVEAIVKSLREKLPNTKILVLAIFPRGENFNPQRGKITQVNQVLQKLDDGKNVFFLDIGHRFLESSGTLLAEIMPDYLHLSLKGYQIWADAIEPKLKELLGIIVADNKPPTITIAAPLANARISNSVALIRGTALDNGVVAQVLVQVNGGPFTPATGTLKWTNQVTLAPGTNIITAKAVDALGLQSVPMVRKIIFLVTEPLNLDVSGTGTLTPNLDNKRLEIGKSYKMVARPGVGFLFESWEVGGTGTNHPTLNFVMRSNLVVAVRFIPNPFIPVKGSYNGLFFDDNQPKHQSAGLVTLTTTDKGSFSGSLLIGTTKVPLTGQFALNGFVRKTVVRTGKPSLTLDLWLDVSNQTDQVTGTVSDGTWTASLSADRATFNTQTNQSPFQGKFTHLILGAEDSTSFPVGDGYGTLTIDRAGKLAPKGALGDGALVTQSAIVSRYNRWPMYHGLYRGTGSIFGWVRFTNATDYAADLVWTKPASGTDALYRLGFTNRVDLVGRSYVTPPVGTSVFTWSNGVAVLDGGNLISPLTNNVATAGAKLNVATNDARKLIVTVNAANGSLAGSFIHPVTGRSAAIKGVVLKPLDTAGGFFPGTNQTGGIRLESRP